MKTKPFFAILLAVIMLFSLCGCGGDETTASDVSAPTYTTTTTEDTTTTTESTTTTTEDETTTVTTTAPTSTSTTTGDTTTTTTATTTTEVTATTTTTAKPTTTTKKPTTTTKKPTTTTAPQYKTIELYKKTTYRGYVGYFYRVDDGNGKRLDILGLPEDYDVGYIGGAITEYYDVNDGVYIYFALDAPNFEDLDLANSIPPGEWARTPVKTNIKH